MIGIRARRDTIQRMQRPRIIFKFGQYRFDLFLAINSAQPLSGGFQPLLIWLTGRDIFVHGITSTIIVAKSNVNQGYLQREFVEDTRKNEM